MRMQGLARVAAIILGVVMLALAAVLGWLAFSPEPAPHDPPPDQIVKAQSILQNPRWAAPDGWQWAEFKRPDGATLRFGYAPATGEAKDAPSLVFVPGFTAVIEQNYEMLKALQGSGVDIYAIELRGQGGSSRVLAAPQDREKTYLSDFKLYADDLAAFLQQTVRPTANGPVVLAGLSLGGHAVLRTAIETPHAADAYALISPAVGIRLPMSEAQAYALTSTLTAIGGGAHYVPTHGPRTWPPERLDGLKSCGADPQRAAAMNAWNVVNAETRMGGGSNLWLKRFIESGRLLRQPERLSAVDRPVLLINPQLDRLVLPEASHEACQHLPQCSETAMPSAHHCPFHDPQPEYGTALNALTRFVHQVAPRSEASIAGPGSTP